LYLTKVSKGMVSLTHSRVCTLHRLVKMTTRLTTLLSVSSIVS